MCWKTCTKCNENAALRMVLQPAETAGLLFSPKSHRISINYLPLKRAQSRAASNAVIKARFDFAMLTMTEGAMPIVIPRPSANPDLH